jgi:hypothetical protein
MTPENDDTSDRYETGYARRMMLKEVRKKRKDDMRRLERYVRELSGSQLRPLEFPNESPTRLD